MHVLQLLPGKDQPLLVRRLALFLRDLIFTMMMVAEDSTSSVMALPLSVLTEIYQCS
jgi:hypothetical protein